MEKQAQNHSRENIKKIMRDGPRVTPLRTLCVIFTVMGFLFYPATLTSAAWASSGGIIGAITMAIVFMSCYLYVRHSGPGRYISRTVMVCLGLIAGYNMCYDIGIHLVFYR